jgi:hypothetical protein
MELDHNCEPQAPHRSFPLYPPPNLPSVQVADTLLFLSIKNSLLRAVISESTPQGSTAPAYKFACNSTIVQHLVPTSSLNKARGGTEASTETPHISTSTEGTATTTATDGKPHVGRRGMHSATGAYWDETKDGMWSFKYDGGEGKGMDVVIMLIWVAI